MTWLDTISRRARRHPGRTRRFTPAVEPLEARDNPVVLFPASICGYVFVDTNGDCIQQSGESPIQGVTITLTGMDVTGATVSKTTTTDNTGLYCFLNLVPGTYTVTETQPTGYLQGGQVQGTPVLGTVGTDVFSNVNLGSGVNAVNYNFCERLPTPGPGSLAGVVYADCNDNGVFDAGDIGIKGVTLTLGGPGGTRTTTTDASGAYSFTNLDAGTYSITETQPAGFNQGTNTFGTLGGVVNGDAITGIPVGGNNGTGYNFGEVLTSAALSISLTKTSNKATYAPGETITYTYVVTNTSQVALSSVTITDDNATPNKTSDDFTVGTVASLGAGESRTFTATVVAPTPTATTTTTMSSSSGPLGGPLGPSGSTTDLTHAGAAGTAGTGLVFETDVRPTGTGYIRSFVRIQGAANGSGSEQGYNTDARPLQFDENNSPEFTRSLPAEQVPVVVVNGVAYREFLLDINQKGSSSKLSVDDIRIFLGTAPAMTATSAEAASGVHTFAGLSPVYDLDAGGVDRTILLDARLNTGSGSGDMILLVPDAAFAGSAGKFVYLYSKMGATAGAQANAGFEEWAVRTPTVPPTVPPPPPPNVLTLTNVATATGTACGMPATATATATVTIVLPPPTVPPPPPTPSPEKSGDTATIGFWHNKNGQALINSLNGGPNATNLANWLATNFPTLYGGLAGKTNADVAALFLQDFSVTGMKVDAQILGAALAVYVTDSDLAGTVAAGYGFNVSSSGTGAKTYNVGSLGTRIGLQNNTSYTIYQLLLQADLDKKNGTFDANAFNTIFDGINQSGDIK